MPPHTAVRFTLLRTTEQTCGRGMETQVAVTGHEQLRYERDH